MIPKSKHGNNKQYIPVPCGKCNICLSNRRNEWVVRLKEEFKTAGSALFVTLTYEDQNLYINENGIPSVNLDHLQKFFKRLRHKKKFRYYAISEYGSKTKRPHYHAIIFGFIMEDAQHIESTWAIDGIPIGHTMCGRLTEGGIGYVSKYHVTKNDYPAGSNKPFVLMSRNPAIGSEYVTKMYNYHVGDIDRCHYQNYETKMSLPRYYRLKLYTDKERGFIATKFQKSIYEFTDIEKMAKKGSNYFLNEVCKQRNREKLFKLKKNANETI